MELIQDGGSIWSWWDKGYHIAVTTNPIINSRGLLVMGRGVAKEAATKFPDLRAQLARAVVKFGNVPIWVPEYRIVTFPTKYHWQLASDLVLIEHSARFLQKRWKQDLILPKVGCGNGRLDWADVCPILNEILDDKFKVLL